MNPINPIAENPTVVDNIPETPQIPQSLQSQKNNHGIMIASMAIFVILALSAVAFLYYQNQQLKSMLAGYQATPTPLVSPEPSAGAETANWKMYANSEYNFSFRYPSFLEDRGVVSGPYTGTSISIRSFSDPKTMAEGTDMAFDGYTLYYVSDMKALDFETFIQNEKNAMDNAEYAAMVGAKRISFQNGGTAYITDTRGYYYFPSNDGKKVVVFGYSQRNESFKSVFDQILSTFQFTN